MICDNRRRREKTYLNAKYANLSDEEIILIAQKGDEKAEEYLIRKYESFAYFLSKGYYAKGVEYEDFLQMSLIGLYKAIKNYNCGQKHRRTACFKSFATLCIKSELATYLKFCNRHKHQILNNSIPILSYSSKNKIEDERSYNSFADVVMKDIKSDPQDLILERERVRIIESIANNVLTDLEKRVLVLWIHGYSYWEISSIIGKNKKSIENSIQRLKKKLKNEIIKLSA